jgi:putative Holliday junction resolvase
VSTHSGTRGSTGPADPAEPARGAAGVAGDAGGAGIVREGPPGPWTDGVRLGVDVGTVRIGVAASDPGGVLATPLTTVARDPRGGADLVRLARLVADREAVEVIVGLPTSLSGRQGQAARAAREYAAALADRIDPVPVRLSDERLTTVAATRRLAEAGTRGRKGRSVVDRSAAVLILQGWLDGARRAK